MVQIIIEQNPSFLNEKDPAPLRNIKIHDVKKEAEERIQARQRESAARSKDRREKDMAMNPSTVGTKKWKKATFHTAEPDSSGKRMKKNLGHIKGAWGVTKDENGWKVIHLQSGLALIQGLRMKKSAVAVVDEMVKEEPSLLFLKAKDASGFSSKQMQVSRRAADRHR